MCVYVAITCNKLPSKIFLKATLKKEREREIKTPNSYKSFTLEDSD